MTEENTEIMEFPCAFQIKIMGEDTEEFHLTIREIVVRHAPEVTDESFASRQSSKGRYVSITATVNAQSREHLDNLYREITSCHLVKWAI
jgi:putative lipoic acid-binding regulatory protein